MKRKRKQIVAQYTAFISDPKGGSYFKTYKYIGAACSVVLQALHLGYYATVYDCAGEIPSNVIFNNGRILKRLKPYQNEILHI
jgi:hypothetical protein